MCHLPALPRYKELVSELKPIHARLSRENSIAKRHPVYKCSEVQVHMILTKFLINILACIFLTFIDVLLFLHHMPLILFTFDSY